MEQLAQMLADALTLLGVLTLIIITSILWPRK